MNQSERNEVQDDVSRGEHHVLADVVRMHAQELGHVQETQQP